MNQKEFLLVKKSLNKLSYKDNFSDNIILDSTLISISEKKELIFSGDNFDALYCVLTEKAFVTSYSENGSKVVIGTLIPGTFFGDIELYSHNYKALHNISVIPGTLILKIPFNLVISSLNSDTQFLNFMCQKLTEKLLVTSSNYSTSMLLPAKNKLAKYLIEQIELHQSQTFLFSTKDISEFLGLSDRHIRRLIHDFETNKILTKQRYSVTVLDVNTLNEFSK